MREFKIWIKEMLTLNYYYAKVWEDKASDIGTS